jgi:hypothetical protein
VITVVAAPGAPADDLGYALKRDVGETRGGSLGGRWQMAETVSASVGVGIGAQEEAGGVLGGILLPPSHLEHLAG